MSAILADAPWMQDKVLRILFWGGAVCLFAIPVIARFAVQIPWTAMDFVFWGVILLVAASLCELSLWLSRSLCHRAAMVLATGAGFFTVWVNMAVGIIESELNDWNLLFIAVLAIGAVGALVARFRAAGMAAVMLMMAVAQVAVAVVAVFVSQPGHPEGWIFSAVLAVVWLGCASLFRQATRSP